LPAGLGMERFETKMSCDRDGNKKLEINAIILDYPARTLYHLRGVATSVSLGNARAMSEVFSTIGLNPGLVHWL
jgi:hypothetical protein